MVDTAETVEYTHQNNLVRALENIWKSEADKSRRAYAEALLRVHRGDALGAGLVKSLPYEDSEHARLKGKYAPPLLPHAVRQLSFLYDLSPKRSLAEEDDAMRQEWQRVLWTYGSGINETNKTALPLVKLLGQVEMVPAYLPGPDAVADLAAVMAGQRMADWAEDEDGIEWRIHTPDRCCAVSTSLDPTVAEAVAIRMGKQALRGPDGKAVTVDVFFFYDAKYWALIGAGTNSLGAWAPIPTVGSDGIAVPYHEHGAVRLPVLAARRRRDPSQQSYWATPLGGLDLLETLSTCYTLWTEYLWIARLQRGQPVLTGSKKIDGGLSPESVIICEDPGSSFAILQNAADLAGIRDALVSSLEILAKTLGLPSRTYRLQDTAAQSGVAIMMDRAELDDERRNDEVVWAQIERAQHRMAAEIYEYHRNRQGLSVPVLDPRVTVEYQPVTVPMTASETLTQVLAELDRGLMSRSEAKAALHPALDPAQVQALLDLVGAEEERNRRMDEAKAEADAERQVRVAQAADPLAGLLTGTGGAE